MLNFLCIFSVNVASEFVDCSTVFVSCDEFHRVGSHFLENRGIVLTGMSGNFAVCQGIILSLVLA